MDFSQIDSALALATTAFGATDKAVSTVQAIKGLFASGNAPDASEASRLLNNLATELTAANLMNVQLSDALKSLAAQLRRDDDFETEKARYQLIQTREGDLVFKLKEEAANGQPSHFICPVCLNRDRLISFLQSNGDYRRCQTDSNHLFHFSDTPLRTRNGDDGGWMAV